MNRNRKSASLQLTLVLITTLALALSEKIPFSPTFNPSKFKFTYYKSDDSLRDALESLCNRSDISIELLDLALVKSGKAKKTGPILSETTTKDGKKVSFNLITYVYPRNYIPMISVIMPSTSVWVYYDETRRIYECSISVNYTTAAMIDFEKFIVP